MNEGKRSRGNNWPYEHKLFLLELMENNLDVLVEKKTDAKSSFQKQKVWQDIKESCMSVHGVSRDIDRLKGMWKRLKLTAKAQIREYKRHKKGNGGGPSADEPSFLSKAIQELLPLEFTALNNLYDDDELPEPTERILFTSTPLVSNKNKWKF